MENTCRTLRTEILSIVVSTTALCRVPFLTPPSSRMAAATMIDTSVCSRSIAARAGLSEASLKRYNSVASPSSCLTHPRSFGSASSRGLSIASTWYIIDVVMK